MNYALIEDGVVTNVIWLHPGNASDFPNAVALNDIPAEIGDSYVDGAFYRDGEKIVSAMESARMEAREANEILDSLIGGVEDVQQE